VPHDLRLGTGLGHLGDPRLIGDGDGQTSGGRVEPGPAEVGTQRLPQRSVEVDGPVLLAAERGRLRGGEAQIPLHGSENLVGRGGPDRSRGGRRLHRHRERANRRRGDEDANELSHPLYPLAVDCTNDRWVVGHHRGR
jgi:hypothetical protein